MRQNELPKASFSHDSWALPGGISLASTQGCPPLLSYRLTFRPKSLFPKAPDADKDLTSSRFIPAGFSPSRPGKSWWCAVTAYSPRGEAGRGIDFGWASSRLCPNRGQIFLNSKFGPVSIIRPTDTFNAAVGAAEFFVDDGLFWDRSTATNTGIVADTHACRGGCDAARRLG